MRRIRLEMNGASRSSPEIERASSLPPSFDTARPEVIGLIWDRVDLKSRVVRLQPGTTTNDKGRTVYLDDEMLATLKTLFSQRRLEICPTFF